MSIKDIFSSLIKSGMDIKEKIVPTRYRLDELETSINEKTGDIVINVNKKEKYSSIISSVNIENKDDRECYKTYKMNGKKYREYFGDYKKYRYNYGYSFNSMKNSIYSILGEEYSNDDVLTQAELIELKQQMSEHIHDEKYDNLYIIRYKDTYEGTKEFEGKKLVYMRKRIDHKIVNENGKKTYKMPESRFEESLIDINTGSTIKPAIYSGLDAPFEFEEECIFDVERICPIRI